MQVMATKKFCLRCSLAAVFLTILIANCSARDTISVGQEVVTIKWDTNVVLNSALVRKLELGKVFTVTKINDTAVWANAEVGGWISKSDVTRKDQAIDYCNQIVQGNPSAANLFDRAVIWKSLDNYERAIKDCSLAISIEPTHANAHNTRGNSFCALGDFRSSIKDYDQAIRLNPELAVAFNGRAGAWHDLGNFEQALADYSVAIRLDPFYAMAYSNRSGTWMKLNEIDQAISDCNAAIQLDSRFAMAYHNRAVGWVAKHEYTKAVKDSTQAIDFDPQYCDAYYCRADAWKHQGRYDRAIKDYSSLVTLNKRTAGRALLLRGYMWSIQGDHDRAIRDYDASIQRGLKDLLVYCARAQSWKDTKNYRNAISDLETALQADPHFLTANMELAWLLVKCPEPKYRNGLRAGECATQACEHSKWKHPAPLEALAAAYAEQGNFKMAIKSLQKAIDLTREGSKKDLIKRLLLYQASKKPSYNNQSP